MMRHKTTTVTTLTLLDPIDGFVRVGAQHGTDCSCGGSGARYQIAELAAGRTVVIGEWLEDCEHGEQLTAENIAARIADLSGVSSWAMGGVCKA
jgi:hypothetical protein